MSGVIRGCRLLGLFVFATSIWCQVTANNGSLEGRVVDRSGAPIPQARVLALQTSTGLERETVTGTNGMYRILSLLPGQYELRIEVGSVSTIVRDTAVRVGSVTQINLSVASQAAPDSVDVSTSVLSLADSELTQVIPFEAIQDLPIIGRRFQDFATLTPTVLAAPETLGQLSFVGQRGVNSNVLIDGTDYNEPFVGGIRGGDRSGLAFTIPQSAIQEYQMVTSGYSAEYGRSTGGVLNAITRSGANEYHGEAFYLARHSSFSARSPFGFEALENQHQFGGAVGGPILANRFFFFGAFEQQLARFPRQVKFSALDGIARTADVAPAYDFLRSLEGPFRQTNDATAGMGRTDYRVGSHALTGRYQWSRNDAANAAGSGLTVGPITNRALSNSGSEADTIRTSGLQITSVFRPELLNDFRAQSSFEFRSTAPNSSAPFLDAGVIGRVGTSPLLPMQIRDRRIQFADAATFLWRGHAFKAGFDYSYINFFQWYGDNQFGAFTISNPDTRRILQIPDA
ncbi:MAG: TonB-dependent receptor [Bryobacteraceae bacterium]